MRDLSVRLANLSMRMAAVSETSVSSLPEAELAELRRHVRDLRSRLGSAGSGAGAPADRVREQVSRFRETGVLIDARAARLVCWGTTLKDGVAPPLMEDGTRFPALLDQVDALRHLRRPYRRCWRGLLDGYIRYDPHGARNEGSRNWSLVREYLNDNLKELDREGQRPDWLSTIDEHSNLLGDEPCRRYGTDLLDGNHEDLARLRQDLAVGDSSWMVRRIFDAQIAAALAHGDGDLRRLMPRIIALLSEHDLLADDALAQILDRYAECRPPEIHAQLRDHAVARWGNPWLERNDSRWMDVRQPTRDMVSSWLKLDLIEKFFGLLSEDKLNDQRRVRFWSRYVDQISTMHFALGESAFTNRSPDFAALRKSMTGRLLRLENGGGARNNAFIMRIGDVLFVEFGEKGNALYAFDATNPPFDLRAAYISGNRSALKHLSHLDRMTHTDSVGQTWETKLDRFISSLAAQHRSPRAELADATPSFAAPAPKSTTSRVSVPAGAAPEADVTAFLDSRAIRYVDLREKGGALWAYAPKHGSLDGELRRHGFAWSDRREAWYSKS